MNHESPQRQDQSETIGIPAALTVPDLQTDAFQELCNKLGWAIGSSYRTPYRNPRTGARRLAIDMAGRLIQEAGYPAHIAKA